MATRETTAKTIQNDLIRRDFEVRAIAQKYTAIRELNITRCGTTERKQFEHRSRAWFLRRYRRRTRDRRQGSRKEKRVKTKKRDGSGTLRLLSQLEVIVSPSLTHVALSISFIIFPMEQVELLADLLGKNP